jgi:hypothetical protein
VEPVGLVNQRYVTSREVQIHYLVGEALFAENPKVAKYKLLRVGTGLFRQELNVVLLEWMVYLEAKSFGVEPVGSMLFEKNLSELQRKLGPLKIWQDLEVGATEAREYVERALAAKKFIEFKEESSRVPITEDEARKYFLKNPTKYAGKKYEYYEKSIKALLRREQANRRLLEWFRVLEAKYKAKSLIGAFKIDGQSMQ